MVLKDSTCYSCQILFKLGFFRHDFEKRSKISNFLKLRQVTTEYSHADGPTDGTYRHDKVNVPFFAILRKCLKTVSISMKEHVSRIYLVI